MTKDEAKLLIQLTDTEIRVYLTLLAWRDKWGEVVTSMDELSELTDLHRSTLSRTMKSLAEQNFVKVKRTKRNEGKLSYNIYVPMQCLPSETLVREEPKKVEQPCAPSETSTTIYTSLSKLNKTINTTYLLSDSVTKTTKEKKVVNRWNDDDDVAGVGLFDFEEKSKEPQVKIRKNDPKTRNLRPRNEWTAADVASEFAVRIYAKIPNTPGIVNTAELRGILSRNRKAYNVTAEIEMEAMDRFFEDTRAMHRIMLDPYKSHLKFIAALQSKYSKLRTQVTGEELDVKVDTPAQVRYLVATDGRQFDNSMPGRLALEKYEAKLKGN